MKAHHHADVYEDGSVYLAGVSCFNPTCQLGPQERVHVFTDAELRARDERIIKESFRVARQTFLTSSSHIDAIIAVAEADQ